MLPKNAIRNKTWLRIDLSFLVIGLFFSVGGIYVVRYYDNCDLTNFLVRFASVWATDPFVFPAGQLSAKTSQRVPPKHEVGRSSRPSRTISTLIPFNWC